MNRPDLAELPWVRQIKKIAQCSRPQNDVPLIMVHHATTWDVGYWRCRNRGEFYFTSHERSWAPSGIYCREHLINVAMIEPSEIERLNRWIRDHYPDLVKDVQLVTAPTQRAA